MIQLQKKTKALNRCVFVFVMSDEENYQSLQKLNQFIMLF
jgi:hypothetical protein